jgi:hypothetical protein
MREKPVENFLVTLFRDDRQGKADKSILAGVSGEGSVVSMNLSVFHIKTTPGFGKG